MRLEAADVLATRLQPADRNVPARPPEIDHCGGWLSATGGINRGGWGSGGLTGVDGTGDTRLRPRLRNCSDCRSSSRVSVICTGLSWYGKRCTSSMCQGSKFSLKKSRGKYSYHGAGTS